MEKKLNKDNECFKKSLKNTFKEEKNEELKENYKLGKKYYEDINGLKESN